MFVALMLGISGSLGHCVGMCGPVAAILSRRVAATQTKIALIFLHLGRLTTYAVLGLVAGGIGQVTGLGFSFLHQAQGVLALAAAFIAIYFALSIIGWIPSPEKLLAGWTRRWGNTMRSVAISHTPHGPLAVYGFGLLWGMLPCGMVLTALFIAATSAGAVSGALNMLAFGIGTLPSLLAVRWLAGLAIRLSWTRYASSIFLLVFGMQFALRGLSVWGIVGHMMVGEVMLW